MQHTNRQTAALPIAILCFIASAVHSCATPPTSKPTRDAYLTVICDTRRPMRERQRVWQHMRKDYPDIYPAAHP